ncbi:MAG TPA: FprA family A-type flavoprotein [Candidatus Dormibacteraeota bacterium]|nr:FprA family A-type flavoprotein [Candidatus Dormibacteraeota bacterium]
MHTVTEVAEDIFRVNAALPDSPVTYSFFVIRDEEPALVETGFNGLFDLALDAVRTILDPATIRHIVIPHLEGDESGALNSFLGVAPHATALCSPIGMLTLPDFAARPPRPVTDADSVTLGKHTLRFLTTPYVHQWDSMMAFDETTGTLFSSDLFIEGGDGPGLIDHDRSDEMVGLFEAIGFLPSKAHLDMALDKIEALAPRTIACHHGCVKAGHIDSYLAATRGLEVRAVDWNPLMMAEPPG